MTEVESYYTQRQLTLAAALLIHKLGLQGNIAEIVTRKQEENISKHPGPQIDRLCSQEGDEVEEDVVLGDIFKTPDLHDCEDKVVETSEFRQSVLLMKGLTGMVLQTQTQPEKLDVLCSGEDAVTQPVYCVLSFFDDKINKADTMELDVQQTWLEEAIIALTQLLNTGLEHPFLTTCQEICHQFLNSSFISLGSQNRSKALKYRQVCFLTKLGQSLKNKNKLARA